LQAPADTHSPPSALQHSRPHIFRCRCRGHETRRGPGFLLYGLGKDLISLLLHHTSSLSSDYGMIVLGIRLPSHSLAIFVGAFSFRRRRQLPGFASQSASRSVRARCFFSSGAALGSIVALIVEGRLDLSPRNGRAHYSRWRIPRRHHHHRRRLHHSGGATVRLTALRLLLGGIITASFLQAVIMFLMTTLLRKQSACSAFWFMGDLSTPQPRRPAIPPGLRLRHCRPARFIPPLPI